MEELNAQRDRAGQLLVADLTRKGPLRPDLDQARAAQILSVFLEPAAYRTLVLHHGWTLTRFSTWLSTTLADQLLPPLR